jgi:hypothetical protein
MISLMPRLIYHVISTEDLCLIDGFSPSATIDYHSRWRTYPQLKIIVILGVTSACPSSQHLLRIGEITAQYTFSWRRYRPDQDKPY